MHSRKLLNEIRDEYAREQGWKSFKEMCENVNLVARDTAVIAMRYADKLIQILNTNEST